MITQRVAGRIYNYEYCIGRFLLMGIGFSMPMDFALGSEGTMYVVSRGQEFYNSHGLTAFTRDHELVWENRGPGYAGGQSVWPSSIDLTSDETIYVSDDHVSRIFMFDKGGTPLGVWGTKGSGDGEMNSPSGIVFDKDDNLYVSDSQNHRIQVFTRDGKLIAKWGGYGTAEGQFNMPWGIALDKAGDVYVADWKNGRIQKFSPEGEYLASFGGPGTGDGELRRPSGVAIDEEGDVYITDWGNERLNIYSSDGTFLTAFIGDAETLSPWSKAFVDANGDFKKARLRVDLTPEWRFRRPVAVNVDDTGKIMVLETQRHRIQIYVKERNFVDAQFNL